jgi:hypothetical protein
MTAAAPAVGTAKDRFISAPSHENWVGPPARDVTGCEMYEREAPDPLAPRADRHVQLLATFRKHVGSILQQSCHRCQYLHGYILCLI